MGDKKPSKPEAPKVVQGGGPSTTPSGPTTANAHQCRASDCKKSPSRFGFCGEHFDQFKFGLITKNGEHCQDYEAKQESFETWKTANKKKAA